MLRIKNEQRWIARVLESILPLCDRIVVLDDHSTDETREICRSYSQVQLYESPFEGTNEARDKNWLLGKVMESSPEWIVATDGDEILADGQQDRLRQLMRGRHSCFSLRVLYLWNDWNTVRMDGVYGDFHRESIFRPNGSLFPMAPDRANFHCGNVPVGNRLARCVLDVPLLHAGYMHRADRERKYAWYNKLDPDNSGEDWYRHMVVGDLFPASSRFQHGGPLWLEPLEKVIPHVAA